MDCHEWPDSRLPVPWCHWVRVHHDCSEWITRWVKWVVECGDDRRFSDHLMRESRKPSPLSGSGMNARQTERTRCHTHLLENAAALDRAVWAVLPLASIPDAGGCPRARPPDVVDSPARPVKRVVALRSRIARSRTRVATLGSGPAGWTLPVPRPAVLSGLQVRARRARRPGPAATRDPAAGSSSTMLTGPAGQSSAATEALAASAT